MMIITMMAGRYILAHMTIMKSRDFYYINVIINYYLFSIILFIIITYHKLVKHKQKLFLSTVQSIVTYQTIMTRPISTIAQQNLLHFLWCYLKGGCLIHGLIAIQF